MGNFIIIFSIRLFDILFTVWYIHDTFHKHNSYHTSYHTQSVLSAIHLFVMMTFTNLRVHLYNAIVKT